MTKAVPKPSRPNPVKGLGMMAIGLAVLVWTFSNSIPFGLSGQAALLILTLLTFRNWPPMIRWVSSMPVPHRVIFALMIGSMILGHYTLTGRTYYPYMSWFIFPQVREEDPVMCREFIATTESGKKVRLLPEQQFPSIVQVYPLDNPTMFPPDTLDHLARAMAKIYNEHHAGDPVKRVELYNIAVRVHPPAGETRDQPSSEFLCRYEISSGQ
ncbi:MAG: hypothetical protein LV479_05055 [Methylacidiphilales bacterium]|nr:hypothetical protein [Candidatus Methylacidiphilales bacterium]